MAKIYPDTNRFIDFYKAAHENLDIFDELQKYKSSIVLTEQTITEFRRNRVNTINQVVTEFKKSIEVKSYTTSMLKVLPGYEELTDLLRTYKKKGKEVLRHLQQFIDDETKDPVARKFLGFASDAAVIKLPLTDQAVDRAHRRKLLGNPPRSSDKYSIGDEVIWELLLENLKEDLIIVTEDHTFRENLSLLKEEYERRTGSKLLRVTKKLSEALKAIGQKPSRKLVEKEKKMTGFGWSAKGSGRHAAALWNKVDDLIGDYAEEIELETGECIGDDRHIIPIMRSLASLINRRCDEVETDLREDSGIGTDESV